MTPEMLIKVCVEVRVDWTRLEPDLYGLGSGEVLVRWWPTLRGPAYWVDFRRLMDPPQPIISEQLLTYLVGTVKN